MLILAQEMGIPHGDSPNHPWRNVQHLGDTTSGPHSHVTSITQTAPPRHVAMADLVRARHMVPALRQMVA